MKISGFTIIRNATLFDFPVVESILSALDLVDEFIIVLGDSSDNTNEIIASISSPKIKIVHSDWDLNKYGEKCMIYAYQTDVALSHCTGDWCLYIQADEVLDDAAPAVIRKACEHFLHDHNVEGFLLKYLHFFGSYDRYVDALHFAYPKEIRIVRNHIDVHSWSDAQSFKIIPDFDYRDYLQKKGTRKLNCVELNAYMYHYGWCRDPRCMVKKVAEQHSLHSGKTHAVTEAYFDYGNLSRLPVFKGKHPEVMRQRIEQTNWKHLTRYTGGNSEVLGKKFRLKYRIINFIENKILGGKLIAGFKNYKLVGKFGFKPADLKPQD
jgi:glycosyltransferase involved in cell wall biosynthesis